MSDEQDLQATPPRGNVPVGRWIAAIALAVCASTITTYIEVLNTRADGFLPRTLPEHGNPKWRARFYDTEARWRSILGPKDEQWEPVTRPLTSAEQDKMHEDIAHAKAMNDLRGAVEGLGLWNYLLVPALLGVALSLLPCSRRPIAKLSVLLLLGIGLTAGGVMFYRGYFTSIGY